MSESPQASDLARVLELELRETYETARTVYREMARMVGIVAAGAAALLAIGFGGRNAVALLIAGVLILLVVVQVFFSWRVMDAVALVAVRIENELHPMGRARLACAIYGVFFGVPSLERLLHRAKDKHVEESLELSKVVVNPQRIYRDPTVIAAILVGAFLAFTGTYLLIVGWP